jgi:NAD(P)H-flavin reductase
MMRASEGAIPAAAQAGLKDSWKAQGYFLPCVCVPEGDLAACEVGGDARVAARIASLDYLSSDVVRVRLEPDHAFEFQAGQYLTVLRESLARSYSIASLPGEGAIELHVRLIANGRMSGWLRDEKPVGAAVQLQGPSGECFYVPGRPDQSLLLVGTGTGLAPLYGIVRAALQAGHSGEIHLVHGALRPAGLYLRDELSALAREYANFRYTPVAMDAEGNAGIETGSIDAVVAGRFPALAGWRGFICGDPAIVRSLKRKLFLAGMPMRDIYSDAFLPSA